MRLYKRIPDTDERGHTVVYELATPSEVAAAQETWANVSGTDGMYQVSTHGNVRSWHGKNPYHAQSEPHILNPKLDSNGYKQVAINGKTVRVHRLVAEAFMGGPREKTVNHIDGDKGNNAVWNLEWASYSRNHTHAYQLGLKAPRMALVHEQWEAILARVDAGESIESIANGIGTGAWNIRRYIKEFRPDYKPKQGWRKGKTGPHHTELTGAPDETE